MMRRRKVKKEIEKGDKILIQRKKTTVKSPWDPEPFTVEEVKGSTVRGRRGEEVKSRAKNRVKVVKERPLELRMERDWEEGTGRGIGVGSQYGSHTEDEEAASE